MPYPLLRPDERRRGNADRPTPGVLVVTSTGRHFFPGGTYEQGMVLARIALGDALEAPETRIEYGTRDGPIWNGEVKYKLPVGAVAAAPVGNINQGWG